MGDKKIHVRNPRTGLSDYTFIQPDARQVAQKIAQIRDAQTQWLRLGVAGRCTALQALKCAIEKHQQALIDALTLDTGRCQESDLETHLVMGIIKRWCQQAPALLAEGEAHETSIPFIKVGRQYVPYAVVGAITPWNFPLTLSCIDAMPALLVGCAVVVKPSEITPRFAVPLQTCIDEVDVLKDVFHFVPGDGEVGAALIDEVDTICFTGSVATGRKVAEAAARNFIPAQLELGGKDPAIITASADLDRAAAAISWGGLTNAGQACLSIERVYVESPVHDEFVQLLTEKVARLRCNIKEINEGEIGPIISAAQIDLIQSHLDDALDNGAVAACGGKIEQHNGGSWCQPTVLTDVKSAMKVIQEETFGPILPIMGFATEEEAIALANDTRYGLSAAVFSNDKAQADRIAKAIQAGAISINDAALTAIMYEGEKQAFKLSGLGGSRMGTESIRRFQRTKSLINNVEQAWDPWWFEKKPTN